jgi:hypothetical protein
MWRGACRGGALLVCSGRFWEQDKLPGQRLCYYKKDEEALRQLRWGFFKFQANLVGRETLSKKRKEGLSE